MANVTHVYTAIFTLESADDIEFKFESSSTDVVGVTRDAIAIAKEYVEDADIEIIRQDGSSFDRPPKKSRAESGSDNDD